MVSHPYVPQDLILEDYVPVSLAQSTIVGVYGIASVLVASFIWLVSGRCAKLSKMERLIMCWWAFTGLTHMVLEGYFVFSPEFYKDKTGNFLAEVWKEYSKGDSRYAGRDAGIVTIEGLTAVIEGPACLLAVYAIAKRKYYSDLLQISISLGQLYGTAAYFVMSILQGDNFAISPFYYYSYYIFANSFWVWIPSLIVIRSWKIISAAVASHQAPAQKKNKTR
ncbi:hypothetical protein C5167_036667 [Papaver somniferum]|uniref:EXPERA domain-containing protein n=1 Tax=Papaver somniferum TaxID=3469 RepID=A0A4Y7I4B1_PAPSO|nr:probable 3-beta-hydroxysteroid-Delta(8),Delta(7)-isomerase [Papaver somniferum]RZC43723.1 hypothetical protein C5167_036667 [Papaver somniferum]